MLEGDLGGTTKKMLVVISDIHFEEVSRDAIAGAPGTPPLQVRRNLGPDAFIRVVSSIADACWRAGAKGVDFVLAGDIFDLHRTVMWFDGDAKLRVRPYGSCADVGTGTPLEARVLDILDAIAAEAAVRDSLVVLRRLAAGKYLDDDLNEKVFPVEIRLHYLPGNHDRLANATPRIRLAVRELLGLGASDLPFEHVLQLDDPRVLVRHGHEYDRWNFAADFSRKSVPARIEPKVYDEPTVGDFMTVDVAMGLPYTFRAVYGEAAIAADPALARVYLRLLEFDDVRPQSRLLDFLLVSDDATTSPARRWRVLRPVLRRLFEGLSKGDDLPKLLGPGLLAWIARLILKSRVWKILLFFWVARLASWFGQRLETERDAASSARREEVLTAPRPVRFVIAGHTHHPQVATLCVKDAMPRLYVDTGTWRSVVQRANDLDGYSHLKALTYVVVYASTEDAKGARGKTESFDYWSGFTQHWPDAMET